MRGMIDPTTPEDAKTITMYNDTSKTLQLIWSDEFTTDGRTFYPGDDPYFTALDIYYWQTQDLEVRAQLESAKSSQVSEYSILHFLVV